MFKYNELSHDTRMKIIQLERKYPNINWEEIAKTYGPNTLENYIAIYKDMFVPFLDD